MALEAPPIAIGTPPPDGSGDASRNQVLKFTCERPNFSHSDQGCLSELSIDTLVVSGLAAFNQSNHHR